MIEIERIEYLDRGEFDELSKALETVPLYLVKANRADSGAPRYVSFFFLSSDEAGTFRQNNQCLKETRVVESRFDDSICIYYLPTE